MEIIYRTLEKTGLKHDEGPDKDGGVGPYVRVSARRREFISNMPGSWWKKERLITASVIKRDWLL